MREFKIWVITRLNQTKSLHTHNKKKNYLIVFGAEPFEKMFPHSTRRKTEKPITAFHQTPLSFIAFN